MTKSRKIALGIVSSPFFVAVVFLELFWIPVCIILLLPIYVFICLVSWVKGNFDFKELATTFLQMMLFWIVVYLDFIWDIEILGW